MDIFKKLINQSDIIVCPLCGSKLEGNDSTVSCEKNHTYDIGKQGYSMIGSFYKNYQDEHYNEQLFLARNKVFELGFFDNLIEKIYDEIKTLNIASIADFGCGEGSIIAALHDKIRKNTQKIEFWGVDLSRDAIKMATRHLHKNIGFVVSDLSKLPFADNSISVIINVLSPIFSQEAKRVLKPDGIILKIIPKKDYLKELRQYFAIDDYQKEESVLQNISEKYNILKQHTINYSVANTPELFENLVNMTPLLSNSTKKYGYNSLNFGDITLSFDLLVLQPK